MKSTKEIQVAKLIAPIIGSRDVVDLLKPHIFKQKETSIVLDFSNVEFLSRSAAHEFLLIKEDLYHDQQKKLSFENTNKFVTEMLRVVAANRALPKEKTPFYAEKIDIKSLLKAGV